MSNESAEFDQIAEWLGDMPEAYNVTDYTDEQTTVITIDVDALARRVAERIAARQAEVANSFVRWADKNEIAEPPLDWAWFGEIARRYSPLHEEHEPVSSPPASRTEGGDRP